MIAAIAFLKSFGTAQPIFSPSARSTSSGSMSQPFFTNRLTTIWILLDSMPMRRSAPTYRSAFFALGTFSCITTRFIVASFSTVAYSGEMLIIESTTT